MATILRAGSPTNGRPGRDPRALQLTLSCQMADLGNI